MKDFCDLRAAVEANDLAATGNLFNRGGDPNRKDAGGYTPLMIAAGLGLSQMVELLLTAGADVFALDSRMGASALHKVAQSGVVDAAELLLECGAFIDLQSATLGHTPLMDAVWHKQTSMVKFLLARNAKTSLQSHYKATAMDFAQRDNLADIVKLIEERDRADAALVKKQVLMKAVQKGDLAKVKKAIAEGANVDEKAPMIGNEWDGYTPLHAAAVLGYAAIVHELLAAGANPRIVDGLMHATPGHKAGYNGHAKAARALVENGNLELDAQGAYNGLTALHDAVWHGHTETVRVYLEAGAQTDLRSATGKTPLELARQYGYEEIAAMIRAKMNEEAKK